MKIHTETGSIYEIDEDNKTICRLSGVLDPTPRQGKDTISKPYETLMGGIELGNPVIIVWYFEEGVAKSTITSNVVKIFE